MTKLSNQITGAKGAEYSDAPQGSPEWIALRPCRIGASELHPWMLRALVTDKETKVKTRTGAYLSGRKGLERQKAFEKAFNVSFSRYVTGAMQEGIDNEAFVRDQYAQQMKVEVVKAGSFYDKWSIASPDGLVGTDGGIEIKWLQDTNWTEVVETNRPLEEHYYQIQGNLRLSGRKWWDYVAANGNTGRFVVITIERDEELIAEIDREVRTVEDIAPLEPSNIFQFTETVPAAQLESGDVWA